MNRTPESERAAIANLQRYLRQLSYFDDRIPPLPVNGIWDPHTRDALMAFQRKNGLEATGRADETTWNLLFDQYQRSIEEKSPPSPMPVFPRLPERDTLRRGDVGFPVTAVQFMLDELTLYYDGLEDVPQNGLFEERTEQAVMEFQRRNLLPATGQVDKRTWDALVSSYEMVVNDTEQ